MMIVFYCKFGYYLKNQESGYTMKKFLHNFKILFVLLCMVVLVILFGDKVPTEIKSFFYAISLTIKNIIIFLLPIIIFTFLWSSLIALQKQAGKFILLLLVLVTISNFIAIMAGYSAGFNILPLVKLKLTSISNIYPLLPTWKLILPQIASTEFALAVSIILGLFFAFRPNPLVSRLAQKLNSAVIHFFKKYFTPILPLFILGFLLKLEHDKILTDLMLAYGPIVVVIVATQILYIILMYLIAANFSLNKCWAQIKNMLPAGITAFSTISSAATLPITIMGTEKNLTDPNFARIIIPATCNIHSIGSAIGLPIVALAAMQAFNLNLPNLSDFLIFAVYYTLAKYAVAGVPGGVIVVVAPLLELYLGFTPGMIGVVTAVYLLLDTFGTMTNVLGNGAFAIIFSKVMSFGNSKFNEKKHPQTK